MNPTSHLRTFWHQLTIAEQRAVRAGAVLALAAVLCFGVLLPMQNARQHLQVSTQTERQRLLAMVAMREELTRLGSPTRPGSLKDEALRAAVDSLARAQLAPATPTTTLDNSLRIKVSVNGVALEQLLLWIDNVRRTQRLPLETVSLKPNGSDPSRVNAQLSFSGAGS